MKFVVVVVTLYLMLHNEDRSEDDQSITLCVYV